MRQRQQAAELAMSRTGDAEGLIVLMPVEADAISDLLEILHGSELQPNEAKQPPPMQQRPFCAVLHQALSPAVAESCQRRGWRVFGVAADQVEMGRIQAEQVVALLGERRYAERCILYLTGPEIANATRLRIAGAVELLLKSEIAVEARHAAWDGSNAREVMDSWRAAGGRLEELDLVAAHCDEVAKVVKEYLTEQRHPEIPVLGMDGTKTLGKPLVDRHVLAVTVVQPLGMREVLDTYEGLVLGMRQWEEIRQNPNLRLLPRSYPPVSSLEPLPPR